MHFLIYLKSPDDRLTDFLRMLLMYLSLSGLVLLPRTWSHIIDCSVFCSTFWDLPRAQEAGTVSGESGTGTWMGNPQYSVSFKLFFFINL